MKLKSLLTHPVGVTTAVWLFLYGIWVVVQLYQGYENLAMPFTAAQVAVASVVGAGVGLLVYRGLMRHRRSVVRRILSAAVSLVLAIPAGLVASVLVMFVTRVSGCAAGDIALFLAVPVAGLTGFLFGLSGGTFRRPLPATSSSQS